MFEMKEACDLPDGTIVLSFFFFFFGTIDFHQDVYVLKDKAAAMRKL